MGLGLEADHLLLVLRSRMCEAVSSPPPVRGG
jgi:hypothetical protein